MIKKIFLLSILSFFIVTINGCSAHGSGKASPDKRSDAVKFEEQKNHSQLYVVRESSAIGLVHPIDVYVRQNSFPEKKIGTLGNSDEYFHLKFEPGNYVIRVCSNNGCDDAVNYEYNAVAGALDAISCDIGNYFNIAIASIINDNDSECQIVKITDSVRQKLPAYTLNHASQQVFEAKKIKKIKTVSTFEPEKEITIISDDDYYTAYRRAESTDTLKAYQSFLRKHPKGMYTTTVKRRISQLQ